MEKRIYLRELATLINRRMNTIRGWQAANVLPAELLPHRDERKWRYWTPAQAKKMQTWMERNGRAPGVGLRNVDVSPEKTQEILDSLRQPRPDRRKTTR